MSVDCRYVFDHCQKRVEVIGPVAEVEAEVMEVQRRFWAGGSEGFLFAAVGWCVGASRG
jgi:hypothetical protein